MEKILKFLETDKVLHFLIGFFIFTVLHIIPIIGLSVVVILAIGKEVYDYHHKNLHTCDYRDAIATILGGIIAFILLII